MNDEASVIFNPLHEGLHRWLGTLETPIMSYLWDERASRPTSVQDVLNHLHDSGREISYTTISTTLTRLFEKDIVTRVWHGRKWVYIPATSMQNFILYRVGLIINSLHDEGDIP